MTRACKSDPPLKSTPEHARVDTRQRERLLDKISWMQNLAPPERWTHRYTSDKVAFSTLNLTGNEDGSGKTYFGKVRLLIPLPAAEQMKLWTTYGRGRDKWDRMLCENSEVVKQFPGSSPGSLDMVVTMTLRRIQALFG